MQQKCLDTNQDDCTVYVSVCGVISDRPVDDGNAGALQQASGAFGTEAIIPVPVGAHQSTAGSAQKVFGAP
jgi:GTPase involved in cell partitioning and DNA repair